MRIPSFILHLITLAMVAAASSWASESPSSLKLDCADLLTSVHSSFDINPNVKAESIFSLPESVLPTESTVMFETARPGRHGGKVIALRKTGDRWVSAYHTMGYDAQGDPRAFIDVLGEQAAAYFGFKITGEETIEIPDQAEFTGALAKVNDYLVRHHQAPVTLTYYQTVDEKNVKVADYVSRFKENLGIPMSPSGNHLLHDMSFHSGGIFVPSELLELKRETLKYLEGFISHLEAKYKTDPAKLKAVRYFAYVWRMYQTERIDNGTAYPNLAIIDYLRDPHSEVAQANFHNVSDIFTNYGLDPAESAAESVRGLYDPKSYMVYSGYEGNYSFTTPKVIDPHLKNLPQDVLMADLAEFRKTQTIAPAIAAKFAEGVLPESKDQYCQRMTQRRVVIRDAAIALSH